MSTAGNLVFQGRGNGELWVYIVLDVRDPATGKRKRKWHSFRGTKREAQNQCSRLITEFMQGAYLEPSKVTVAEFLEKWLGQIEPPVAPRTFERYQEIARKNIVPLLGQTILTKLRPDQIATAYAKAIKSGRRDGSGGLSSRTVHHMHRVLKQALATAVRWRTLLHSPVDSVDPPKVERTKMKALDPLETARLLSHFRSTRIFVPVRSPAGRNHRLAMAFRRSFSRADFGGRKHGTDNKGHSIEGDEERSGSNGGSPVPGRRGAAATPRLSSRRAFEGRRRDDRSNLYCRSRGQVPFAAEYLDS
jgi:hypothetical protein